MLPGEEIIHVLPQEYKVDGQSEIKEPIGMYGGRLEANFHVVVGQVSSIKNIGRCIKSAGLSMGNITLEPLASSEAVLSREEKEAGVALIDIGGGTTDLAIFKDGIIRHTAVIPFGGNVITEDIKEGCSIIEKQAELLKIKFGSAWPGENKDTEIVSIPDIEDPPNWVAHAEQYHGMAGVLFTSDAPSAEEEILAVVCQPVAEIVGVRSY